MLDYRMDTFLSLCETKSYTKTAAILHLTQPSVTQHIKYLEHFYQCPLFHYDGKHCRGFVPMSTAIQNRGYSFM